MAFVRGYKRYETKERKSIEIRVNHRLMCRNCNDAEEEILVNPGIIELQEPAATRFKVTQVFQRLMEKLGGTGKKVIPPVRDLPPVHEMFLQQQSGPGKSLPFRLVGKRGDDILRV
jgi:hypothetical protein